MTGERSIEAVILNPKLVEFGGLPVRATPGAAAIDLRACEDATVIIAPGETYRFKLGFAMHIHDPSVAALVLPRSGLSTREGLVLANTVGLIDSDYMGEIVAVGLNRQPVGGKPIVVEPGDRIFQMMFVPVVAASLAAVTAFTHSSERGEGGYGSTGR